MADQRKTITIKLTPGKDNDLIQWWDTLPTGDYTTINGGRQDAVKTALRLGLRLPLPAINRAADSAEIDALRRDFESQLDEAAQHINALYRHIENLMQGTGEATYKPQQTAVEPAPVVSNERLEKRAKNLNKSSW